MKNSGYIGSVKKYAIHDGPGIRTTVFFKGCPLNCWWCHNPECQTLPSDGGELSFQTDLEAVMKDVKKDIIFFDQSGGGVTFSGGEPLFQIDFLCALLDACKASGIHTAVDTCGYAKYQCFEKIFGHVDLFLYDLKIINDDEHVKYTGISNKLIHDNLIMLSQNQQNIRIRIPLIPSVTDTELNLTDIARVISNLDSIKTVDILPYNQLGISKYRKLRRDSKLDRLKTQSREEIKKKQQLLESFGLVVNIGGG